MSNGTGTKSIGGNWLSNMMVKGAKKLYNKLPESVTSAVGDLGHIVAGEWAGAKKEFERQKNISSEDFHKGAGYNYLLPNSELSESDRVMRPHTAQEIKNKEEYMSTVGDESKLQALISGGPIGLAKNIIAGNSKAFDYNLATNKDFGGGYDSAQTIGDRFAGYVDDIMDGEVTYTEPVAGTDQGEGNFVRNWYEAAAGNAVDVGDHSNNDPANAFAKFNRDRNWFTEDGFKERTRLLNERGMSAKDFYTRAGKRLLEEGNDTSSLSTAEAENTIDFDSWNNPDVRFAMQTASGEILPYDDSLTM